MSLPVMLYSCTDCDFEQADVVTWGRRVYVLDGVIHVPVNWHLGWCEGCAGLAAVEDLSIVRRVEEYRDARKGLNALPQRKLLGLFDSEHDLSQHCEDAMEDAIDAIEMLARRGSPARCLRCGCTKVHLPEKRILPEEQSTLSPCVFNSTETHLAAVSETASRDTIFRHPGCTGELIPHADENGLRIALKDTVSRYTPEGRFIEKVDCTSEYRDEQRASNRGVRSLNSDSAGNSGFGGIPRFLRKHCD